MTISLTNIALASSSGCRLIVAALCFNGCLPFLALLRNALGSLDGLPIHPDCRSPAGYNLPCDPRRYRASNPISEARVGNSLLKSARAATASLVQCFCTITTIVVDLHGGTICICTGIGLRRGLRVALANIRLIGCVSRSGERTKEALHRGAFPGIARLGHQSLDSLSRFIEVLFCALLNFSSIAPIARPAKLLAISDAITIIGGRPIRRATWCLPKLLSRTIGLAL